MKTERVVKLELDFFDPEPNVPEPVLIKSELECYLVYNNRDGERIAIRFLNCSVAQFGYPNDEAFGGHRLYSKGFLPYRCYEVIDSEWIADFRRRNKVVYPERDIMQKGRHFVFSFHDSTFECVAVGIEPVDEFPQIDNLMMGIAGTQSIVETER